MSTWIIEPRDPIIVRDGRPFGPDPGVRAVSLPFPFPSTTTGAVRTRAGLNQDGHFDKSRIAEVKAIAVRGPLLVEWEDTKRSEDTQGVWRLLAPAPADALVFAQSGEDTAECRRLVPLQAPEGALGDLPAGLALVGQQDARKGKPRTDAPAFWRWEQFEGWLSGEDVAPARLAPSGPTRESRIHIQRDPATGTGEDGKLFETSGLEFTRGGVGDKQISNAQRLALAVAVEAALPAAPPLDTLGGERRLVTWRHEGPELPRCPAAVRDAIAQAAACRLIVLTPACFAQGFRPTWLLQERDGVTPQLIAAAVGRPQVISGWDLDKKQPKPTRRLTPAGSVYFLKLAGDKLAIDAWVDKIWMQCISDDDLCRRDSFGLAVLGTWDGVLKSMECEGEAER